MATQREIQKRIKSVSTTKKITKTMEMISTSKMKKMQIRLNKSRPFEKKVSEVISTLLDQGYPVSEDIMFKTQKVLSSKLVLMISGNRGLCSGYNTNVIENTLSFRNKQIDEGVKHILLHVIGKKGINYCKFLNIPMHKYYVNPEDKITFEEAKRISSGLIDMFMSSEINEIYVSYTKMISSASYKPFIYRLLPVSIEELQSSIPKEERKGLRNKYIVEPGPERMFSSLIPLYITSRIYINLLESGYAEQNARRVAMKNATDAATDIVKNLTTKYNRARQAKITNEIAEIVGGASALE